MRVCSLCRRRLIHEARTGVLLCVYCDLTAAHPSPEVPELELAPVVRPELWDAAACRTCKGAGHVRPLGQIAHRPCPDCMTHP